jgi:SAM-dependent methyltransferase
MSVSCFSMFREATAMVEAPRVLELGVKQSQPGRSTMHRVFVPHASEFLGTDFESGPDVDVVADLHNLSKVVGVEQFDAIISCSTLEHVKYPWIAACEIARSMKVGGVLFIQTHQTFPLHSYPFDYWRFSREALEALFTASIGFGEVITDYEFPCQIYSEDDLNARNCASYLNVRLCARKTSPSPADWQPGRDDLR